MRRLFRPWHFTAIQPRKHKQQQLHSKELLVLPVLVSSSTAQSAAPPLPTPESPLSLSVALGLADVSDRYVT